VRVARVVENEVPFGSPPCEATPEGARAPPLADRIFERRTVTLSIHALVVESAGRRILVDTCVGERRIPGYESLSDGARPFLRELEEAGFAPRTIDVVLCTHMHFDHVGWNTVREGGRNVPTFPNARYLFARAEWEHWTREPSDLFTPTFDECVRPLVDAGQAELVEPLHRITPEVRLEPSPGHTPGHVSVRIESRGEHAFVTGDMTHHPVQWAEPAWKMVADLDPEQAIATRRRLRDECAAQRALVIGTHYAAPCAGIDPRTAASSSACAAERCECPLRSSTSGMLGPARTREDAMSCLRMRLAAFALLAPVSSAASHAEAKAGPGQRGEAHVDLARPATRSTTSSTPSRA
jgi:glyoxylase-like metal-dependent hydrolase (beta-lactamase superfamily II)